VRVRFDETGSIAPLGIGLLILTATLMMTITTATSLFIFQKRLTTFAEADALFIASSGSESSDFIQVAGTNGFESLKLSNFISPDGRTVNVTACAKWSPIVVSVSGIGATQVCSHAAARAGN
jgi:hypothetical protein